jgi:hypothetical protein
VADFAKPLKVVIIIRPALELRGDMVTDTTNGQQSLPRTFLTKSIRTLSSPLPLLVPPLAVATGLPAAASVIGELADLAIRLMRLTVSRTITD